MSNKDLLKQAIAEAKTIREAAIANAKEALEETLTPHLKEMLAQKLQEMDDEDNMEEYGMEHNDRDLDGDGKVDAKDTRLAEAEEEEAPEEEAEETEEGEEEEELEIEDMSVEDLKDLIRDIVAQEVGHDESEEEVPGEEAPEGDMVSMDGDSEEIDINELLAELELEGKGKKKNYMEEKLNEDLMQDIKALASKYGKAFDAWHDKISNAEPLFDDKPLDDFSKKFRKVMSGDEKGYGLNRVKKEGAEQELEEALQAVKILRNQLQEVNLLNAKLLYVNKVFKSNNLSELSLIHISEPTRPY